MKPLSSGKPIETREKGTCGVEKSGGGCGLLALIQFDNGGGPGGSVLPAPRFFSSAPP